VQLVSMSSLAEEAYCYLTTTGRVSGQPREIEIWFGLESSTLYMLSGGGERSDWVKNLIENAEVRVRIASRTFDGRARIVSDVDQELVDQPGFQVLLGDVGAAADRDVLVAGRLLGLLERGLDAVGDEGECGAALLRHRLAGVVGEDEDGMVEWRVLSPPGVRV